MSATIKIKMQDFACFIPYDEDGDILLSPGVVMHKDVLEFGAYKSGKLNPLPRRLRPLLVAEKVKGLS